MGYINKNQFIRTSENQTYLACYHLNQIHHSDDCRIVQTVLMSVISIHLSGLHKQQPLQIFSIVRC